MSFLKSTVDFLGLEQICADPDQKKIFSLGKQLENFPSIDVFHKACPAIPRMAVIEKTIDNKFKDFISANGELIETISIPFLKVLGFHRTINALYPMVDCYHHHSWLGVFVNPS